MEKFRASFALLHLSRREGYGLAVVEAAYNNVPAILINYQDNAATDLQINPELICESDSIENIIDRLKFALCNQNTLQLETRSWVKIAKKEKSYENSIGTIEKLMVN